MEVLDTELKTQVDTIDKRLKELERTNRVLMETMGKMKDMGRTWMLHNIAMKKWIIFVVDFVKQKTNIFTQ